eukprot:gnl/TRDRNA2_/TRDRNA2_155431_c1_seq1.p1 gnl/TRDRNA2_/TRDRNA2_155431_c1~~gnl/TRDRNA2_/TRDRNA2_155431_c1_seq1.p1  ORF type:complete len:331 (-),score=25.63 gnl/TRDRNA2_/TRDRNA2_155431_c1_seq1:256-1248(-)
MYGLDEQMRVAPFYVCTAPLVCSLLRAVFEKPLLGYFGMQIHVNVDRQKDQLWLMHFREMVRNTHDNVFVVHNYAMREQFHYATGARLEVMRPRALYAHSGVPIWRLRHVHDGPVRPPRWNRQVLFFRSSYFQVSLLVPMLEHHLDTCAYPLNIHIVRNSSDFVSFRALRRYRAVVLFPWDPALMAFYELYSLGGPAVFVPHRVWAFKIQQMTGWIWSQPSGAVELAGLSALAGMEAARGRPDFAYRPWWRPEDSVPEQALYWFAHSDYERLPHLVRFHSFAGLLNLLLDSRRLRQARTGMRRHAQKALQFGLGWYKDTVGWLLIAQALP